MKILSFISGLLLVGLITYFGYYTASHSSFVIWFGVITAIIAPLAFEFILYPFRSKDKQLIKELSKVPQIEKLIKEASDNESKIKLLEQQKLDLDKLISYESKRRTLLAERNLYVIQGEEALRGIEKSNQNLTLLLSEKQQLPESLKSLQQEIENIESTDLAYTINGKKYVIKKKYFEFFPYYGNAVYEIFKATKVLMKIDKPK